MGHPEEVTLGELNNICPYFTMFPLAFPAGVLNAARRKEGVIDPFCGRGTTLLAGRMRGLRSYGVDSNPVAAAIAEAKVTKVRPQDILHVLKRILAKRSRPELPDGEFWQMAFEAGTLRKICHIREDLLTAKSAPSRVALRAIMLGALHGPLRRDEPWYFSNQMPRTYASKPAYSVKYWKRHGLVAPAVDVADLVARRAEKYFAHAYDEATGVVVHADSRTCNLREQEPDAKWIVTSPPYYGMRSYGPDQWLREWFLGGEPRVDYRQAGLNHGSPQEFAHDLALVWTNMANYCRPGATMVVRFGGINDRPEDPRPIIRASFKYAERAGWEYQNSRGAGEPVPGRRQASQFARPLNKYVHERDYFLTLST